MGGKKREKSEVEKCDVQKDTKESRLQFLH